MNVLPHHVRFTRALTLGLAASAVVVACESTGGSAQSSVSRAGSSSGEGASTQQDAVAASTRDALAASGGDAVAAGAADAAALGEGDAVALRAAPGRDAATEASADSGRAVTARGRVAAQAAVVNGATCSPAGATRTFGDPRDRTHCTCFAHGRSAVWDCYTDSMAVEGPLPPPELSAV